ncbi:MAG TPA: class I SAM-dependent methyltransferase [Candidatus Nanoarchaeia archaeon]|nr:class I SAM-dependent methyltransferase [Candidatus Nanoarchaeia archaeon]
MMQENNPSYLFIASLLEKFRGSLIIDNGCGKNEFKRLYNKNIIGLDIKEDDGVDVVTRGDSLPFKDESVDVFVSNFVLEHVEDEDVYLKEMRRCLKGQGRIILSVPRPSWYLAYFLSPGVWLQPLKEFKKFLKNPLRFFAHGHPHKHGIFYEMIEWGEERYISVFKKAGLSIEERHVTCNFLSLNVHYAKLFGKCRFPDWMNVHKTYVLKKRDHNS